PGSALGSAVGVAPRAGVAGGDVNLFGLGCTAWTTSTWPASPGRSGAADAARSTASAGATSAAGPATHAAAELLRHFRQLFFAELAVLVGIELQCAADEHLGAGGPAEASRSALAARPGRTTGAKLAR